MVLNYLRIGRVQTYPADWLLVLVPFLSDSNSDLLRVLILSVFMFFVHLTSFGENSLLDFTQGYDKRDPAKSHHPLSTGAVSVHNAVNLIHWGKTILMFIGCLLTFFWSPNPVIAMFCLFMWYAWGTAYNAGLSKESILGFVPISVCFAAMGAWGWFLSHVELTSTGLLFLVYIFLTILFQISWSGHLKEMGVGERSNILIRMGARLVNAVSLEPVLWFEPGWSSVYGFLVKAAGLVVLVMMADVLSPQIIWMIPVVGAMAFMAGILCSGHRYERSKELKRMSLMEILSIYAPIPLLLPWVQAVPLMALGVVYFVVVNRALWGVAYPKV